MKYLISTTEVYRVDSEEEVEQAIKEAKEDGSFILTKYDRTFKERKSKGEVIDSYFILKETKSFNDEKAPISEITVSYEEA